MKTNTNRMITLLCFIVLLFVQTVAAQTPAGSPLSSNEPANQQAAPAAMNDDDRLPFMQDDRNNVAVANSNNGAEAGSSWLLLLRTVGAMLLIVGLIFFGAWSIKKFGANFGLFQTNNVAKPDAPDLIVLNSVSVGTGRTLVVVRFGERNLLVGSTAQSFTLLADEEKSLPTAVSPNSRSVAELLAEENNSFADELDSADERLNLFGNQQF